MVYNLRFASSKCSLFHNSIVFGSCIIRILYTGCAKTKKNNSGSKRLTACLFEPLWRWSHEWPKHVSGYYVINLQSYTQVYLLLLLQILYTDHDILDKTGYKVAVKLVGYMTDKVGADEEKSCGRFIWGLSPGTSLTLWRLTIHIGVVTHREPLKLHFIYLFNQ